MSRWWRAYDEAIDDPKLLKLTDEQHRAWFNILCIFSAFSGRLPDVLTMSLKLRMQERKVKRLLSELQIAGLLDDDNGLIIPHNWSGRQYKSDVSTSRVKRFRQRPRNVSVTPPENREQNTETEEDTADAVPPKYVFECGVIRLNQRTFNDWTAAFPRLDLRAELTGMAEWASEQGDRWFHAVSGLLAKRNRDAKTAIEKAEKQPQFKYNGLPGVI